METPSHSCRLSQLSIGARALVHHVHSADKALCRRLLSLGVVAGTEIQVKGVAPLGDPIQVEALGYKLSLRKTEAAHIEVTAFVALPA